MSGIMPVCARYGKCKVLEIKKPGGLSPSLFNTIMPSQMSVWIYGNFFPILAETLKGNHAFNKGKQRVILTTTDVIAGMDLGTALTINYVAGFNNFSAEFFAPEALSA
jgi:hypothetical protein